MVARYSQARTVVHLQSIRCPSTKPAVLSLLRKTSAKTSFGMDSVAEASGAGAQIAAFNSEGVALVKDRIVHSPYPDVEIPTCTLYNFLSPFWKQYGSRTAFIEGDESTSYSELTTLLRQYATGFHENGVRAGDRIIIAVGNSTEAVISIMALMFSGCVPCFSSGPRTARELAYHIDDGQASFCLTDNDNLASVIEQQSRFKKIFLTTSATSGFLSVSSFKGLPEMALEDLREADTKKALGAIAYTSGTTGDPKGVMLSQYSFVAAVRAIQARSFADENDVVVILWGLYHVASIRLFLSALSIGTTSVIVNPRAGSAKLIETIKKHQVTTVLASAAPMQRLVVDASSAGEAMKCVRTTLTIGGTLLPATVDCMRRVFELRALCHAYGLTEAAGPVLMPPVGQMTTAFLGFACPGVLVKVVDIDTREPLPAGKSGEICVHVPTVMMGYLNKPEATKEVIDSQGWLLSGDCGYYDEDGRVHYIDRLKDAIKCLGFHVPTAELEHLISSLDEVRDAAVVGVPSAQFQDAPVAFVVPVTPSEASAGLAHKIKQYVAEKTPSHMHLYGGVVFTDALPRNPMGKVLKNQLRKQALDNEDARL